VLSVPFTGNETTTTTTTTTNRISGENYKRTRPINESITEKKKESSQGNTAHGQFSQNPEEKLVDNVQ
jgi:hypothetical protein